MNAIIVLYDPVRSATITVEPTAGNTDGQDTYPFVALRAVLSGGIAKN